MNLKCTAEVKYLRHLWKEADGERQRQAEGCEADEAVDGQDEPPPPLQERKPGGTNTRTHLYNRNINIKQQIKYRNIQFHKIQRRIIYFLKIKTCMYRK